MFNTIKTMPRQKKLIVGGLFVLGILVGAGIFRSIFSSAAGDTITQSVRSVEVRSVADLMSERSALSIVGTVSSNSEATVRAESSGAVTHVYKSLGQSVSAGTIVAELENASQRAAVMQAQAGVDAAQANLARVAIGGDTAKAGAVNALLSAYGTFDSSIRGSIDPMIDNPSGNNPKFLVSSTNSQLVSQINYTRPSLNAMWQRQQTSSGSLSTQSDLDAELTKTMSEVRSARTFVDNVLNALNSGIPSQGISQTTIDGYIIDATAARSALTATLSALTNAQATLSASQKDTGTSASPDIAAAQAQLSGAQASLASARANLEKSLIRSPISGTINSFSLKQGDFVQQFSPVLTVANNGALEVVAYLSQQDSIDLSVGSNVSLEGGNTGVITHVAPALDPVTKKIEVRIGVSKNVSLLNGQSVTVTLPNTKADTTKPSDKIIIPISAIKVGAQEVDVFTVASSTVQAHAVTLGELLGDKVVVTSGLTPDMRIVVDARGLRNGEVVEVK